MLYTRKGDGGDTYFFGCNQRFSKSSELAEALGAVDEINSLLGLIKIKATNSSFVAAFGDTINRIGGNRKTSLSEVIEQVQQDLFIIQANLAGAKDKKITQEKIQELEKIIDGIEKEMPAIKTFFLSGGTELSALFDYARAIARRAERRVVKLSEKAKPRSDSQSESTTGEKYKVAPEILAYMNRLSSLLYALARIVNVKTGVKEDAPNYK